MEEFVSGQLEPGEIIEATLAACEALVAFGDPYNAYGLSVTDRHLYLAWVYPPWQYKLKAVLPRSGVKTRQWKRGYPGELQLELGRDDPHVVSFKVDGIHRQDAAKVAEVLARPYHGDAQPDVNWDELITAPVPRELPFELEPGETAQHFVGELFPAFLYIPPFALLIPLFILRAGGRGLVVTDRHIYLASSKKDNPVILKAPLGSVRVETRGHLLPGRYLRIGEHKIWLGLQSPERVQSAVTAANAA
jgi:hypothetical protein